MKKYWHVGLLLAAGILVLVLLHRGIPQKLVAAIGDTEPDVPNPSGGTDNAAFVNTAPGLNQTYNVPNAPVATDVSNDANYLTPMQLEASLAPQADSVVQNVLSVGADYAEFVPQSEALQG